MTQKELDWIFGKASDFMMSATEVGGHEVYNFTAFSSPLNYKIPIRFILESRIVDYLVLEYNSREILRKCCGITARENTLVLDCDLPHNGGTGAIEYYVDEVLTFKLHKHLTADVEYAV